MDKSEVRIQYEIVSWYNNAFCLKFHEPQHFIFSVPNESRDRKETMIKKSMGLKAGVSDLIIIQPDRVLFVEVKTDTGRQSLKQKEFQNIVERLGFRYLLVRSLNDFKQQINTYNSGNVKY